MAVSLGNLDSTGLQYSVQRKIFRASSGELICLASSSTDPSFKVSSDNGATWSASWTAIDTLNSTASIDVFQSGNDIYLIYTGDDGGTNKVIFVKLTFSGGTWSAGTPVDIASANYADVSITIKSNGDLWVCCRNDSTDDYTTYYSTDSGANWNSGGTISTNGQVGRIISQGSNLWIISQQGGGLVYYEYTSSWSSANSIAASGITNSINSLGVLKISDSSIWAAVRTSSGIKVYKYTSSWDSGTLVSDNSNDTYPNLANKNSNPVLVYSNGSDVIAQEYSGSAWGTEVALETASGTVAHVGVVESCATAYMVVYRLSASPYTAYFRLEGTTPSTNSSTITSAGKIVTRGSSTITADGHIKGTRESTIPANTSIKVLNNQSGHNADATIVTAREQETIASDATIKQTGLLSTITSDAAIKAEKSSTITSDAVVEKTYDEDITSDAVVKRVAEQSTLTSDATILWDDQQRTIAADAKVVTRGTGTILADSRVVARVTSTITSDTVFRGSKVFIAELGVVAHAEKTFNVELTVAQDAPVDPTGVSATNMYTGDAIALAWTGAGNYGYNVYKEVGGAWVKLNDTLLDSTAVSYVAGALTTGVTYTFKVVGVNGVGTESTGVQKVATPTFLLAHYTTKPVWTIYIDGVEQEDTILDTVELVYGPAFSSAKWHLNVRPDTVGLPVPARQVVTVYINNRLVFTGYLTHRDNKWSSSDISVSYSATGKLWVYTWKTGSLTGFNTDRIKSTSVDSYWLLRALGLPSQITGVRSSPGDIRDMTQLDIMESVARSSGNWQLYTAPDGTTSFYHYGYPVTERTYTIGVNILEWNDSYDISAMVDTVIAYSGKRTVFDNLYSKSCTRKFVKCSIPSVMTAMESDMPPVVEGDDWKSHGGGVIRDESGAYFYIASISAPGKLLDVKAFTENNQPPEIVRVETHAIADEAGVTKQVPLEVVPGHSFGSSQFGFTVGFEGIEGLPSNPMKLDRTWPSGTTEPRPAIAEYSKTDPVWSETGAEIAYLDDSHLRAVVKVSLGTVYKELLFSGNATFWALAGDGTPTAIERSYMAMEEPLVFTGACKLFYSFENAESTALAGTVGGQIGRTIHDDGVQPYSINVSGGPVKSVHDDNVSEVAAYMAQRAQEMYSQYRDASREGSMTILGDESLDLRTQINGMEVTRVCHSFTNGFITTVDLTMPQKLFGAAVLRQKTAKALELKAQDSEKHVWSLINQSFPDYVFRQAGVAHSKPLYATDLAKLPEGKSLNVGRGVPISYAAYKKFKDSGIAHYSD